MAINNLPDGPQPTDTQAEFDTKAFALFNALNPFVNETNAVVAAFNFNSTNSTSNSTLTIGTGLVTLTVQASKSYVIGMTVKIALTSNGANWMLGDVTAYNSGTGVMTVNIRQTNGTAVSQVGWTISQNPDNSKLDYRYEARTANTMLVSGDRGKFINITSGTFTQTFDAAASLSAGWYVRIKNSGNGDITLDPSGTQTIDGRTTFIMFPGECRDVFCDGTNLFSVVINPFFRRLTASYANLPIPPGYTRFGIKAWSAGSSGSRSGSTATLARGGSGGCCIVADFPSATLGTSQTVTIGAGGARIVSPTTAGGNVGGSTTFGSILTANAGSNYQTGGSVLAGLTENATNGDEAVYGAPHATPSPKASIYSGGSASSDGSQDSRDALYGGASGGSVSSAAVARLGGTSTFGGNGGNGSSTGNGVDGVQPGGGGGATQTGTQSGKGGDGEVHFWGIV